MYYWCVQLKLNFIVVLQTNMEVEEQGTAGDLDVTEELNDMLDEVVKNIDFEKVDRENEDDTESAEKVIEDGGKRINKIRSEEAEPVVEDGIPDETKKDK